jgi:hypothetical protein
MMSTALNLSPQVLGLGDTLITKLTGFAENEENFEICHDFGQAHHMFSRNFYESVKKITKFALFCCSTR